MSRVVTPQPSTPSTTTARVPQEKIAMRAYEKWCQRGMPTQGTADQDWHEAECELQAEFMRAGGTAKQPAHVQPQMHTQQQHGQTQHSQPTTAHKR